MPKPLRGRKMRLHKKLRTGPFQQLGFEMAMDGAALAGDSFLDDFVEFVECQGLLFGGSPSGGFFVPAGRGSATEAHRNVVESWLSSRPEVRSFSTGPLQDAWEQ